MFCTTAVQYGSARRPVPSRPDAFRPVTLQKFSFQRAYFLTARLCLHLSPLFSTPMFYVKFKITLRLQIYRPGAPAKNYLTQITRESLSAVNTDMRSHFSRRLSLHLHFSGEFLDSTQYTVCSTESKSECTSTSFVPRPVHSTPLQCTSRLRVCAERKRRGAEAASVRTCGMCVRSESRGRPERLGSARQR